MKNTITAIFLSVSSIICMAAGKADLEVSYNYKYFHRTGVERNAGMILLANASESKFYSPETEYVDSLESSPAGRDAYNQMKMAAFNGGNIKSVPSRRLPMYIFKDKAAGETEVYDGQSMMLFTFTEPYEAQEWEICDSTATILGYECTMAVCDFRGRRWTAWFTPEIPVQDGPWKLSGLPGLILAASESSGQHAFTATGLQTSEREISPVFCKDAYEKTDRIAMLKALREFDDNPEAGINAALGIKVTVSGGIKVDKSLDYLETDYR